MKYVVILCWLLSSVTHSGCAKDLWTSDEKVDTTQVEYDPAEIHQWKKAVVTITNEGRSKYVTWGLCFIQAYRGRSEKGVAFSFSISTKDYDAALSHPDLNRGVVLMLGAEQMPALYCWLRPLGVEKGRAYFDITVPFANVKNMYIGFIPINGKTRYLYNLGDVLRILLKKSS